MSGRTGGEFPRGTQSVASPQAGSSSAGGSVTSQLVSEAAIALEGGSVYGSYGYSALSCSEARVHWKNHIDSLYTQPAEERGEPGEHFNVVHQALNNYVGEKLRRRNERLDKLEETIQKRVEENAEKIAVKVVENLEGDYMSLRAESFNLSVENVEAMQALMRKIMENDSFVDNVGALRAVMMKIMEKGKKPLEGSGDGDDES